MAQKQTKMKTEMKTKDIIILSIILVGVLSGLTLTVMYGLRAFNAATIHTQVIKPKPGVECVVVSSTESITVDCWKAL